MAFHFQVDGIEVQSSCHASHKIWLTNRTSSNSHNVFKIKNTMGQMTNKCKEQLFSSSNQYNNFLIYIITSSEPEGRRLQLQVKWCPSAWLQVIYYNIIYFEKLTCHFVIFNCDPRLWIIYFLFSSFSSIVPYSFFQCLPPLTSAKWYMVDSSKMNFKLYRVSNILHVSSFIFKNHFRLYTHMIGIGYIRLNKTHKDYYQREGNSIKHWHLRQVTSWPGWFRPKYIWLYNTL